MKLLIFGTLALVLGSLTGYSGSYFVDSGLLNQNRDVSGVGIKPEHTEVLSAESPEETIVGDNIADNTGVSGYVTPATSSAAKEQFETTPSKTLSLTPTPSPITTPIVSITAPASSQEINGFIEKYAVEYGVDPHILRGIAMCESGFNPSAVNKNYTGLYQFSPSTWKTNRSEMQADQNPDLRFNAEESVRTAAYMLSVGKRRSWPVC
jgi:hypothetical protein